VPPRSAAIVEPADRACQSVPMSDALRVRAGGSCACDPTALLQTDWM